MSYFAIVTCRNSQDLIEQAVESIFSQTVRPRYVIVIDDGSADMTGTILQMLQQKYENLFIITNPDNGHDTTRIVFNWNKALRLAETLSDCDHHLIATDDIILEPQYVEKLLGAMAADPKVVIASGIYHYDAKSPHGAGRLVNNAFFQNTKWSGVYPEQMGYESAILHEAMRQGYRTRVVESRFQHVRPLGKNHKFRNFGASMKTLGYHPLYVLGRTAIYFFNGEPIGRIGAIRMLVSYLGSKPDGEQSAAFNRRFDDQTRSYIYNSQKKMIIHCLHMHRIRRLLAPSAKNFYRHYVANNIVSPLNETLVQEILSFKPASAFEFGCGQGKNLKLLQASNVAVSGVDISSAAVSMARQVLLDVYHGDERYLAGLSSKSVDMAFTCSVLDHIENIDGIMRHLKRIARTGIVIAETNDKVGKFYYPHDYEQYGFVKTGYSYHSAKPEGNGATYYIWTLKTLS